MYIWVSRKVRGNTIEDEGKHHTAYTNAVFLLFDRNAILVSAATVSLLKEEMVALFLCHNHQRTCLSLFTSALMENMFSKFLHHSFLSVS